MPKSDAEVYLDHLTTIFGGEQKILKQDADDGGPAISIFIYESTPEPGMITGVTYGLSQRNYPDWTQSRPEMIISMESTSHAWPAVAMDLTAYFASKKRFCYGDVFTVDGPLVEDTEMDAVLIFAQSILEPEAASVQLSNYRVHLSQYYPFYRSEVDLYGRIGLEAFWKHPKFEIYDPKRPRIE
ncbi:MAG: suppressor of fused domain protein [Prosthecobacter sp.]|uniref:suppressor of fused domain protein n=1 Tax=Prosthecobacter sp. TaxID=1965333 RepID=UPI0019D84E87|nr:suppressor of fused domain protein [Prosthecobacter sp.]MBE2286656.1 suppressor of fused domain protein [Prosthecobacter sp.]